MKKSVPSYEQKQVISKAYIALEKLEEALQAIKAYDGFDLEVSILCKIDSGFQFKRGKADMISRMGTHWKNLIRGSVDMDFIYNPEIGTICIAGFLGRIFVHAVNGRILGTLSIGPYGILRGTGLDQLSTERCIKDLTNGNYLLIVRGGEEDLSHLKVVLEDRGL